MKTINTYISATERISSIDDYINEKLVIGNNLKGYKYHPKDKNELIECIKDKIEKEGLGIKDKPLDLNDIDTSMITDMSKLFDAIRGTNKEVKDLSKNGNFDISDWDVSNVENMYGMFYYSKFNGDISRWDVRNVKNMAAMFDASNFSGENGDISNWDVSNVENMDIAFYDSPLEFNPPKWYHE